MGIDTHDSIKSAHDAVVYITPCIGAQILPDILISWATEHGSKER